MMHGHSRNANAFPYGFLTSFGALSGSLETSSEAKNTNFRDAHRVLGAYRRGLIEIDESDNQVKRSNARTGTTPI